MLKKIIQIFILIIFVLLSSLVYISFVIKKPCQHKIKALDPKEKFNLTNEQIKRLQQAIQIQTVSYQAGHENRSAKLEFNQFKIIPYFHYLHYFLLQINLYFYYLKYHKICRSI